MLIIAHRVSDFPRYKSFINSFIHSFVLRAVAEYGSVPCWSGVRVLYRSQSLLIAIGFCCRCFATKTGLSLITVWLVPKRQSWVKISKWNEMKESGDTQVQKAGRNFLVEKNIKIVIKIFIISFYIRATLNIFILLLLPFRQLFDVWWLISWIIIPVRTPNTSCIMFRLWDIFTLNAPL